MVDVPGVVHAPVDLGDAASAARAIRSPSFRGTTHVVYAALQESSDLAGGWRDRTLMARNLELFRHALEPLVAEHGATLQHVSLLQGAKAYGLHVGRSPVPAKERAPRDAHDNFYFLQEDALRELADGSSWSWTILRPQVVFGESFASPMNLVPAIGVYAALERERGHALSFPGGPPSIHEAVDPRLLARVLAWAADAPAARGETFNVTNGDVYSWHDVWPRIAARFGMDVGEPSPARLAEVMPPRAGEWSAVVERFGLRSPAAMAGVRRRIVGVRRHPVRWSRTRAPAARAAEHGEAPPGRLPRLHRHRGHARRVARTIPGTQTPAALSDRDQ